MVKRLLQKGDIIRLEKGMTVYAEVPHEVAFIGFKINKKNRRDCVEIGRIYERKEMTKQELVSKMIESVSSFIELTETQVGDFIDSLNLDFSVKRFDTSIYAGEYVVDYVCSDGGCAWQGYPDGWHVLCYKKDDQNIKVDFYQTGAFTAMLPDIEPINVQ